MIVRRAIPLLLVAASLVGCGAGGAADLGQTGTVGVAGAAGVGGSTGGAGASPGGAGTGGISGSSGTCGAGGTIPAGINPSCAGGLTCSDCLSCCERILVPGGMFDEQNIPMQPTKVSPFFLDTFEVTVGRFRKFVDAYPGSTPVIGAGAHPSISGTGWRENWNVQLPTTRAEFVSRLKCSDGWRDAWTDTPGANENLPVGCVNWYEMFAFCAWDGGRLPTVAEWECAGTGCGEARKYPWGDAPPDATLAIFNPMGLSVPTLGVANVGSRILGNAKWGHRDMAGNVSEWVFDTDSSVAYPCVDCITLGDDPKFDRVTHGGSVYQPACLPAVTWCHGEPSAHSVAQGARCARSP